MKGNVKWYNPRKGYGFIHGEDEKDVFVHQSDIPLGTSLSENDEVQYEIEKSDRGLKAKNIKKV
jgi:CspA family cold shock protein